MNKKMLPKVTRRVREMQIRIQACLTPISVFLLTVPGARVPGVEREGSTQDEVPSRRGLWESFRHVDLTRWRSTGDAFLPSPTPATCSDSIPVGQQQQLHPSESQSPEGVSWRCRHEESEMFPNTQICPPFCWFSLPWFWLYEDECSSSGLLQITCVA